MTKKEIVQMNDALSVLVGQPLQDFTRAGAILMLDFGELIELEGFKFARKGGIAHDENGNLVRTKKKHGKFGINSICSMRFIHGNDVILSFSDIYIPIDELNNKEGFNAENFDWRTIGNTIFDEGMDKHFRRIFDDYIVKSVGVGKFGDLTIIFENDCVLEFFSDTSGGSENWRFGETTSCESLIVTSSGIVTE